MTREGATSDGFEQKRTGRLALLPCLWISTLKYVILCPAMADLYPILSWNPRSGYHCTACEWTIPVHIGSELPEEDDQILEAVRSEFAEHVRHHHSETQTRQVIPMSDGRAGE
jgi:hypothetical protein